MEAIQGKTPGTDGNITAGLKTALSAAGISVDETTGSGTITVNADTSVTIAGTITFTLNGQSYDLTVGGYDNGYPDLK